jgi:hypothetical protein
MTRLWPSEDERSPHARAFDEAATPVKSNCALLVLQRDRESVAELRARARREAAADKLGRYPIVVSFVAARDGRPAPGQET